MNRCSVEAQRTQLSKQYIIYSESTYMYIPNYILTYGAHLCHDRTCTVLLWGYCSTSLLLSLGLTLCTYCVGGPEVRQFDYF